MLLHSTVHVHNFLTTWLYPPKSFEMYWLKSVWPHPISLKKINSRHKEEMGNEDADYNRIGSVRNKAGMRE